MKAFKPLLAITLVSLLWAGAGCGASSVSGGKDLLLSMAQEVDVERMMEAIEYMASEELGGRPSGSRQSRELEDHFEGILEGLGLEPLEELGLEGFRQEFQVPPERCFLVEPPPPDTPVICANVLAKLPGVSPDEMVIITANYDGLGMDASRGTIYPGADYNASGASAVLEIARVFSAREEKPERTVVFALLGAEECGGYGSAALAESLESAALRDGVRIINLEGIGAGKGYYMDVWDLNYRKNRPTVEAVDEAASLLDVELELGGADPGTTAGSFFLYHMPAVTCDWSWFERTDHPDFHLQGDTPDRLNRDGLLRVTQVVAVAAWTLAQ